MEHRERQPFDPFDKTCRRAQVESLRAGRLRAGKLPGTMPGTGRTRSSGQDGSRQTTPALASWLPPSLRLRRDKSARQGGQRVDFRLEIVDFAIGSGLDLVD